MRTLRIHAKALFVYVLTWVLAIGLGVVGFFGTLRVRKELALARIPAKPLENLPPLVGPVSYEPTVQSLRRPADHLLIQPPYWLVWEENCILGARMNVLKRAGLIPKDWTMAQVLQTFPKAELLDRWGLNWWDKPMTDQMLAEIKAKTDPASSVQYHWHFVKDMDELIQVARRGEHVMVHIAVWFAPDKKNPQPHKYDASSAFHHAVTITGIKWIDPKDGIVEFEVEDPFPFGWLLRTPTYSAFKEGGYNLWGRQGVPYIGTVVGRPGYVTRESNVAAAQVPGK